jgi:cyclic beta-1,2-glucan synthetase
MRRSGLQFSHAILMLVFLPYEAYFSLDAILRSSWRMLVSRKRLLEWRASNLAHADAGTWRTMWASPVLALFVGGALLGWRPTSLPPAALFLLAWLVAPAVADWISRPIVRRTAQLTPEQHQFLNKLARRTWAYFDRFVGPEDNWLPPDNMQEHPALVIAHRTSPTNIGMALLANLSASDFGYITVGQMMERTAATLETMDKLERHQGHFYNWYDTQTLKPLHPCTSPRSTAATWPAIC